MHLGYRSNRPWSYTYLFIIIKFIYSDHVIDSDHATGLRCRYFGIDRGRL